MRHRSGVDEAMLRRGDGEEQGGGGEMSKFTMRFMRFVPMMATGIVLGGALGRKW